MYVQVVLKEHITLKEEREILWNAMNVHKEEYVRMKVIIIFLFQLTAQTVVFVYQEQEQELLKSAYLDITVLHKLLKKQCIIIDVQLDSFAVNRQVILLKQEIPALNLFIVHLVQEY